MSIKEAIYRASKKIAPLEAEILLAFVLNKTKEWLWTYGEQELNKSSLAKFGRLVRRRARGEPLPYLVRRQAFFGLDFYVDKNVFIPRPESEILAEEALKELNHRKGNVKIAEIGTGSGCLSVAIVNRLKNKRKIKIYATDISPAALKVAKRNILKYRLSNKITLRTGDLLEALPEKVDMIVANLPYLKNGSQINQYEPKTALFGGKNGTKIIKKLLRQATNYLNQNGQILLEIDHRQKEILQKLIQQYLPTSTFRFQKDLSGLTRVVIITSSPTSLLS